MGICLGRGAALHMAELMPLPPTVSCFSKILIVFTFLVLAHPGSPEQRAVKWVLLLLFVHIFILCICQSVYLYTHSYKYILMYFVM